ncbi:23S rRNA (guanosine(2251)-2'-O)-methyltransferase RlmB [Candidatus Pantoea edessiphila]|uniref:23S rRNA (Guanosine(2251)-2'-O)-methyltransferase RlmB n=1 Tax=Candidatus Pantoea edessiphila TaxID=2044610 RepID=A0A2P5SVU5_9GAMM|nr:23S rRNA (guanosine(2251)-2'-O)-methyltransferase RlmB [Candidatus Pantoea edessiphila]PPI86444.1 23S rRNA (guanosine(2251)-2'-O)-methyltransferase RlmB [Candidatus Pantoea edessiphila]
MNNNIIFGIHPIDALQKTNHQSLQEVFILKDVNNNRLNLLKCSLQKKGIKINLVDRKIFTSKVKDDCVHQGIVAIVKYINQHHEEYLYKIIKNVQKPFLLILDCITDPHNLGACIRTADAAGVDAIVIPKKRSASINKTVHKVASGGLANTPVIRVTNLARILCLLKKQNILVVGTSDGLNNNLYEKTLLPPIAVVIGSESTGIRYLTRKYCDIIINIPMYGIVSSLNVSVATGICLFEIIRQRNMQKNQ